MSNDSDYTVGYCKPPVQHQFQTGKSGNPAGRKKGSRNEMTMQGLLDRELNESVILVSGDIRKKVTAREAIVKKQVIKAVQGDPKATEFVFKKLERQDSARSEGLSPILDFLRTIDATNKAANDGRGIDNDSEGEDSSTEPEGDDGDA